MLKVDTSTLLNDPKLTAAERAERLNAALTQSLAIVRSRIDQIGVGTLGPAVR